MSDRLTFFDSGKWRIRVGQTEYAGEWVDRIAAFEALDQSPTQLSQTLESFAAQAEEIDRLNSIILSLQNDLKSAQDPRLVPKHPIHDSLADRACPNCDAYISWDALNEPVNQAPMYCKACGQSFDWSQERGYDPLEFMFR